MISVMDILASEAIEYHNIRGSVEVDAKTEQNNKVERGDLVFVRSSEVVGEVGWAKAYTDNEYALFSGFSIRGKKKDEFDNFFVELSLNSKNRPQIESKAGGSTRFNVSQSILNEVELLEPTLPEQTSIGNFFRTLDSLIAATQRKLDGLKQMRSAYLQQMFPQTGERVPRLRFDGFSGDWEIRKLGDCFIKGGSGGTPLSTKKEYYDGDIPFLSISDVTNSNGYIDYTEKRITEEGLNNSAAWIVSKGAISLAMYASVGKLAILNIDVATSQAFYNMIFGYTALRDFIYQRLSRASDLNEWTSLISQGTQQNLNAEKVKNFEISVPSSRDEQDAIGVFLNNIDIQISAHSDKVQKLKELKIAYLQKMFI